MVMSKSKKLPWFPWCSNLSSSSVGYISEKRFLKFTAIIYCIYTYTYTYTYIYIYKDRDRDTFKIHMETIMKKLRNKEINKTNRKCNGCNLCNYIYSSFHLKKNICKHKIFRIVTLSHCWEASKRYKGIIK